MATTGLITPVILSGGAGTRLWPLSRPERPKQFLPLVGSETMLAETLRRVEDRERFAPPLIIASAAHRELLEEQLAGVAPAAVVLEPSARNTAPAIALATLLAEAEDLLLVMPSDHVIADPQSFGDAVEVAAPLANSGWIVTFGIEPDRPETGFGYIKRGDPLTAGAYAVDRFVEKPDLATAERLIADGEHAWNGGIFLFSAATMRGALERHAPEVLGAAARSLEPKAGDGPFLYPDAGSFGQSPSVSIDYAVMEKADKVAVVPVQMGWSDVGSWDALYDLVGKDAAGNGIVGDAIAPGAGGSLIRAEGTRVVAIGVEELIVIATPGEVLIVPRGRSQEVKEALERHPRR